MAIRKLLIILGIPIDDLNMADALDRLEAFIVKGRETGKTHQVATVNADFVVKAMGDPELRYLLQEADMATADGMPLVWGARLLGVPLEGRVAGADLIPALAERSAEKGYSVYFLGAAPGVAAKAAQVLQERYPTLKVAGVLSPPYSSVLEMDPAILQQIHTAKPDILLVAFGNPKQEKWIGMYGRQLGVPVMIGVGGTLDFIAGQTKRAPKWMQDIGLEWLFRLLQEPGRLWRRYVVDMVGFSSFFVRQWWVMRSQQLPPPSLPTQTELLMVGDKVILNVQGRLDTTSYKAFSEKGQEALTASRYILVNLSRAEFLDSSAVGALVGLAKQARDAGGELWLTAVPAPIYATLRLLRLDRFFVIQPVVDLEALQTPKTPEPSREQGKWTVVKMPRRLDATTSAETVKTCALILQSQTPYLILDFSETAFLASAGLAALSQLNRQAAEQRGAVRLAGCSADVVRVIQMVRFDKILSLYADVSAATA